MAALRRSCQALPRTNVAKKKGAGVGQSRGTKGEGRHQGRQPRDVIKVDSLVGHTVTNDEAVGHRCRRLECGARRAAVGCVGKDAAIGSKVLLDAALGVVGAGGVTQPSRHGAVVQPRRGSRRQQGERCQGNHHSHRGLNHHGSHRLLAQRPPARQPTTFFGNRENGGEVYIP